MIQSHSIWFGVESFTHSQMYCANLVKSIYFESSFFSLILILQGINLDSADLSKLDLRFINFKMANLRKTDLAHANLSNCCLERANLCGAHMDVSSLKSDFNLISPFNVTYQVRKKVWRINRFINLLNCYSNFFQMPFLISQHYFRVCVCMFSETESTSIREFIVYATLRAQTGKCEG